MRVTNWYQSIVVRAFLFDHTIIFIKRIWIRSEGAPTYLLGVSAVGVSIKALKIGIPWPSSGAFHPLLTLTQPEYIWPGSCKHCPGDFFN